VEREGAEQQQSQLEIIGDQIEKAGNQCMKVTTVTTKMKYRMASMFTGRFLRTGGALTVIGGSGSACFLCVWPSLPIL